MKCLSCLKQLPSDHQHTQNPSFASKKAEIQSLKNLIFSSKHKLDLTLEQLSSPNPSRTQQQCQQQKCEGKAQRKLLNIKLEQISEKQNQLKKLKGLKKQIREKTLAVQQMKRAHNQKLTEFVQLQRVINSFKQELAKKSQTEIKRLQYQIDNKKSLIARVDKIVKRNMHQVVNVDLMSLWRMNEKMIGFEQKEALRIKKVDDLEFMDNLPPEDRLAQGFIELQNVQEVFVEKKLSQKAIHLLYQNILTLTILQKLCRFWLPYSINCQININESKLSSRIGQISILNKKIIDFAKSTQISSNIVQFFPDQVKRAGSNQNKAMTANSQTTSLAIDETLEYYKRKYQLNQAFVNWLQINIEFLCARYGITQRPLVFLQGDLMKSIVKQQCQYMRNAHDHKIDGRGFTSMLKQIKVSKMIEAIESNNDACRVQVSVGSIHQQGQMDESEGQQIRQANDGQATYWTTIKQSVYELIVPESLDKVTSSDTDNDEFQLLTF